jgi:hypothetical protein
MKGNTIFGRSSPKWENKLPCYNTPRNYTVYLERHVRSLNMPLREGKKRDLRKEYEAHTHLDVAQTHLGQLCTFWVSNEHVT